MDRLDFLGHDELLRFFHSEKTAMSCMKEPHTFLRQLRDHDLIPEDKFKIVSHQRAKEKLRKTIYDILDHIERERAQEIRLFWKCVFHPIIMEQYETLQRLNKRLLDGSYHFKEHLSERKKDECTDVKKRKELTEDEEDKPGNEKKKQRTELHDDQKPGLSSQLIPASAVKKEKNNWRSPIYKWLLPVTCGDLKGTLHRERLAKGGTCILFHKKWFTPTEFEKLAGRESSRNWRLSIRCEGTPLGKLIQKGDLKSGIYKGGCKKKTPAQSPSDSATKDDEEPEEQIKEQVEEQPDVDHDNDFMVFIVECEDVRFEPATEASRDDEGALEKPAPRQPDVSMGGSSLSDPEEMLDEDPTDEEENRSTRSSDEEQPSPSARLTSDSSSSTKEVGELPVTCGDLEGTLHRDRLAKADSCILFQKRWFTPSEFERLAGRESFKNWKLSIRSEGIPLAKLIQKGDLKSVKYKGGCKKTQTRPSEQKHWYPFGEDESEEDESKMNESEEDESKMNEFEEDESKMNESEEDETKMKESEQDETKMNESEEDEFEKDESKMKEFEENESKMKEFEKDGSKIKESDSSNRVFKVTCGAAAGKLHRKRFGSGSSGPSIRTKTRWMTPEEFVTEASGKTDASWETDIRWKGKPLDVLMERKLLRVHFDECECLKCRLDPEEMRNDDECFVCHVEDGSDLVRCVQCPRSFHQNCHLPYVDDSDLSGDRPWMCTFCEVRCYNDTEELDMEAALSQYTSRHMLKCQYLLLKLCSKTKKTNVATSSPGVQNQWLVNVARKLQSREYETVGEFKSDVQLHQGAAGTSSPQRLEMAFRKVFNIR